MPARLFCAILPSLLRVSAIFFFGGGDLSPNPKSPVSVVHVPLACTRTLTVGSMKRVPHRQVRRPPTLMPCAIWTVVAFDMSKPWRESRNGWRRRKGKMNWSLFLLRFIFFGEDVCFCVHRDLHTHITCIYIYTHVYTSRDFFSCTCRQSYRITQPFPISRVGSPYNPRPMRSPFFFGEDVCCIFFLSACRSRYGCGKGLLYIHM